MTQQAPPQQQPRPHRARREYRGTGVYPSIVIGVLLLIAILIGILMNLQSVPFNYVGVGAHPPLAIILIVAVAATAVLTEMIGLLWRHRRRRQLAEREELLQLRAHAVPQTPAYDPAARTTTAATPTTAAPPAPPPRQ